MWAYLKSIFSGILIKLGFLHKEATLVLVGLDNAGKTTLQYRIKTGSVQDFTPTQRAKDETLTIGDLKLHTWDLGGHVAARMLWKKYACMANGVIFMVDAADPDRLGEAKAELQSLCTSVDLSKVPILILANKVDSKSALTRQRMEEGLNLAALQMYHSMELFMVSVINGTGYEEGFQWISSQL